MILYSYQNALDPDWGLLDEIEIVQGVVVSTDTDVDKLYDGWPGSALMIVGDDLELTFRFTSGVWPELLGIINPWMKVAGVWRGDSGENWASPAIGPLTTSVPTIRAGRVCSSPWIDNRSAAVSGQTAWNLRVLNNVDPVTIGELWMGVTLIQIDGAFHLDDHVQEKVLGVRRHQTHLGASLKYEQMLPYEEMGGTISTHSQADIQKVEDMIAYTRGGARNMAFIPSELSPSVWLAEIVADRINRPRRNQGGFRQYQGIRIKQVGGGLAWADPLAT